MNQKFRERIQKTANRSLGIIDDYFSGKITDDKLVREATKMVQFGVKIEHLDQIKNQGDKSLALRLVKFLPDEKVRQKYLEMTNPEIKPLLLSKPKKK